MGKRILFRQRFIKKSEIENLSERMVIIMKNKYLIIVDMQNDFITGSLKTAEAQKILPYVINKVSAFDGTVLYTMDTHYSDYLTTQEGKLLPVLHCIFGTSGWELPQELKAALEEKNAVQYRKTAFGSKELALNLLKADSQEKILSIELAGLCTDVCVISNALIIRSFLPHTPLSVDTACCAGTTPEKHSAALEIMRSCQINTNLLP